jgi:hypothetical protein
MSKPGHNEGIMYVATGMAFLKEAAESSEAGRKYAGNRSITVVTDLPQEAENLGCFDICLKHPDPTRSYRDKISGIMKLPFKTTLFLDTDARLTYFADDIFALGKSCDFAASFAPVRNPGQWSDPEVPALVPEFNSGVMLFNRGKKQHKLIRYWLEIYDKTGQAWDQATLRSTVWAKYLKGIKYLILPPEANLRLTKPWVAGKGSKVYVVHGRVPPNEWKALISYHNDDISKFRTSDEWNRMYPDTKIKIKVSVGEKQKTEKLTI